jgi:hypothetical protein
MQAVRVLKENVMDYTPKQAMRAYNRIMDDRMEILEIGRLADAGYDAGEFSGSYHDAYADAEEDRIMHMVCQRMSVTITDIQDAIQDADHYRWY